MRRRRRSWAISGRRRRAAGRSGERKEKPQLGIRLVAGLGGEGICSFFRVFLRLERRKERGCVRVWQPGGGAGRDVCGRG